ncbi:MAG: thiol-disulfide oxidoreductase DCC family protein [Flavobacteriaceae bacterium]|nr:thiol-disulfide oxidoreductase DCC family protein [Flavobacteriaceae bacterium]
MIKLNDKSLILFDGVCNLCNSSVQFIIKRDKKDRFLFSSLQSDAGQRILLQNNRENLDLETILLIEGDRIYDKSTAILKIMRKLSGGYPLLYAFMIVPKFIRDFVYMKVAKNRYKWFGKMDACMIPTEDLKMKFLD